MDSIFYTFRSGGLEDINMNSHSTSYHFAGHYPITAIVADTNHHYVYLKNYNYIGKYNEATHKYENIIPDSMLTRQFYDIDVSPDGKIWAAAYDNSKEVAIYNGHQWHEYHYTASQYYYGFSSIRVVNDTLAYVYGDNQKFFAFHNGIFDSIFSTVGYSMEDWNADQFGNIWIAARNNLLHFNGSLIALFDDTNSPIGTDQFLHVKIGVNGHIWTAGDRSTLLEFDGSTWQTIALPHPYWSVENFSLDKQDNPWVVTTGEYKALKYAGGSWNATDFPFIPFKNIKALGAIYYLSANMVTVADEEGIFKVNLSANYINGFSDTSEYAQANNVNCFVANEPQNAPAFGTNQGIQALPGFSNTQLPNDTVNNICYDNGTYYIATNNGLLVYNGLFYNNFNTSNSPLPSNRITFVTTGNSQTYWCNAINALYVGTDKGFAIYQNTQWKVYDSSNIAVNNFYVTGIQIPCYDTSTYISTRDNGLIALYPNGGYNIYNTTNGNLLDDTLYYVKEIQLAECGSFLIAGTSHHGIAYIPLWWSSNFQFEYDTLVYYNNAVPFASSHFVTPVFNNFGPSFLVTSDNSLNLLSPCGSIAETNPKHQELKWILSGDELIITVPDYFTGKGNLMLTDMLGKPVVKRDYAISSGKIMIDISNISSGIYVFTLINGNNTGYVKVAINHN